MTEADIITDHYQHVGVLIGVGLIVLALVIGFYNADKKSMPKKPSKTAVHAPQQQKPRPRAKVRFRDAENDMTWVNLGTGEIRVTETDLTDDPEWAKVEAWETK